MFTIVSGFVESCFLSKQYDSVSCQRCRLFLASGSCAEPHLTAACNDRRTLASTPMQSHALLKSLRPHLSLTGRLRTPIAASALITAAYMASSGPTMDSRADRVMSYWFGADWQTQGKFYKDDTSFKKWFMGGAAVDEASCIDQEVGYPV
jgi:hypothetical protein